MTRPGYALLLEDQNFSYESETATTSKTKFEIGANEELQQQRKNAELINLESPSL